MQSKLNSLVRATLVAVVATVISGTMVATAVSAKPQALFTPAELIA